MKYWLLRLHRWLALAFAVPLLVVLGTSIILSVEPAVVTSAIKPGTVTVERIEAVLAKHDPENRQRSIAYRSYDGTVSLGARNSVKVIDVATGEAQSGPSTMATVFMTSRRLHEKLLLDLGWLVIASTAVMLILGILGVLMGWPKIRNTVSGWHKAMAWGLLPLLLLSPLTGLLLSQGISVPFPSAPRRGGEQSTAPLKLLESVKIVGAKHDLSSLVWLRQRGENMLVRLVENGEYKIYRVTHSGTLPQDQNWVRLWHEGNFAGVWSALMNLVTALAAFGLLLTGVWIWSARKLRRRTRRSRAAAAGV